MERLRDGFDLAPDHFQGHAIIANSHYARRGDFDEALAHLKRSRAIQETPAVLGHLGYVYGAAGRRAEAQAILSRLLEKREQAFVPATPLAWVHLGLGEHGEALRWLETAYEERDMRLVWLKEDSRYAPLRNDPRYQELVHRMNFPEE